MQFHFFLIIIPLIVMPCRKRESLQCPGKFGRLNPSGGQCTLYIMLECMLENQAPKSNLCKTLFKVKALTIGWVPGGILVEYIAQQLLHCYWTVSSRMYTLCEALPQQKYYKDLKDSDNTVNTSESSIYPLPPPTLQLTVVTSILW